MKINLNSINREDFIIREREIAGEVCYLVFPKGVPKWTKETMVLRSSIWNSQGELISGGFPKFFNYGEQPELYPDLNKYKDYNFLTKIDGSLLVVSSYKNELICRTRGVFSAKEHENGFEIDVLKEKYPQVFELWPGTPVSFLYEWVSDNQKIILNYENCPDIYLVGVIKHDDYSLLSQEKLDKIAKTLEVKRPPRYQFGSLEETIKTVKELKGVEGICLYYNNDQNIVKLKSDEYLSLHRLKNELSSIDKLVDLFFTLNCPNYLAFLQHIEETFDFELAKQVQGNLSRICDAYREVKFIIEHMIKFVEPLKTIKRKDAATKILESYGKTNRASFVFTVLDKGELDNTQKKKLLFQLL